MSKDGKAASFCYAVEDYVNASLCRSYDLSVSSTLLNFVDDSVGCGQCNQDTSVAYVLFESQLQFNLINCKAKTGKFGTVEDTPCDQLGYVYKAVEGSDELECAPCNSFIDGCDACQTSSHCDKCGDWASLATLYNMESREPYEICLKGFCGLKGDRETCASCGIDKCHQCEQVVNPRGPDSEYGATYESCIRCSSGQYLTQDFIKDVNGDD